MEKKELYSVFTYELPEYYDNYYDEFEKNYVYDGILLADEDIELIKKSTGIEEDCADALKKINRHFCENKNLHEAACFWRFVTVYKRQPWENYIYSDELIKIPEYPCKTVNMLFVSLTLAYTLKVKKPPEELNKENLGAYAGYISQCKNTEGYLGINEFNWNVLCAGGCMFMCGELKFCPSYFTDDFPVLKKGNEYISLAGGEFYVGKEGELVDSEAKSVCKTTFCETETEIIAHRISKAGKVSFKAEVFPKSEYEQFLRGGDCTMDIHIPSKMEYTVEVIRSSFLKAIDFYGRFMPEHKVKAFAGYSWIFAPQLSKVMSEGSNILKVNSFLHILPTIGSYNSELYFIRQGSSLCERIKKEIENGTEFHYSIMYKPVDEL